MRGSGPPCETARRIDGQYCKQGVLRTQRFSGLLGRRPVFSCSGTVRRLLKANAYSVKCCGRAVPLSNTVLRPRLLHPCPASLTFNHISPGQLMTIRLASVPCLRASRLSQRFVAAFMPSYFGVSKAAVSRWLSAYLCMFVKEREERVRASERAGLVEQDSSLPDPLSNPAFH